MTVTTVASVTVSIPVAVAILPPPTSVLAMTTILAILARWRIAARGVGLTPAPVQAGGGTGTSCWHPPLRSRGRAREVGQVVVQWSAAAGTAATLTGPG